MDAQKKPTKLIYPTNPASEDQYLVDRDDKKF